MKAIGYLMAALNAAFSILNLWIGISDFQQHGHFWIFNFLIALLGAATSVACFRSSARL